MKILIKILSVVMLSISIGKVQTAYGFSLYKDAVMGIENNNTGSGCRASELNINKNVFNFIKLSMPTVKEISCLSSNNISIMGSERFNGVNCSQHILCQKNVGASEDELKKVDIILNEVAAGDYAVNSLVINADDMENLEVFKKFAQKKYGMEQGLDCKSSDESNGANNCDLSFMEKKLVNYQKSCDLTAGCYNQAEPKIDSFSKYQADHEENKGQHMMKYFKYRLEQKSAQQIDMDEKRVNEIAEIVEDPKFKKGKQDYKLNALLEAIGKDKSGRLNDPILGYDFGKDIKKVQNADKLKELKQLLENKNLTSKSFAVDFEKFRKKRALANLGSTSICNTTTTFLKICKETTAIYQGKSIIKDPKIAEVLSTKYVIAKNDEALGKIKEILGTNFKMENMESLLNARRCVAFSITDTNGKSLNDNGSFREDKGWTHRENSEEGGTTDTTLGLMNGSEILQSTGVKTNSDASSSSSSSSSSISKTSDNNDTDAVTKEVEPIDTQSMANTMLAPKAANNYSDMYNTSNFDAFAEKDKSKIDGANDEKSETIGNSNASSAVSSTDKMNDYLMKKLAASEESLEKMKADKVTSDEEMAKQKKMDEESAVIKDLKNQISDLKTETAKAAVRKSSEDSAANVQARPQAVAANDSFFKPAISSVRADSVAVSAPTDNFDVARSAAAAAAGSEASRSPSSMGAVLTAVSNSDGSKTTTLGSGLVLTTVDGMTSEKASQTISNRIIELNGVPFYIEEGGMVKEIIAVVKDGKVLLDDKGNPVYEKIVKGKVGDKKFASTKIKKDRAPAAITDMADLRRDQEEKLKRDRVEYLKLKKLTNEALQKN
jgi:hypothetical protein